MALDIKALTKATGNQYGTIVGKDGIITDQGSYQLDTGSLTLNALLSGTIFGGASGNKITGIAGKSGVGKTFFLLEIAKAFLEQYPKGIFVLVDTEAATTQEMLESRVGNTDRIIVLPIVTVEEFRTQTYKLLDEYEKAKESDPDAKLLFGLDSLGNLSTAKEVTDIQEGNNTRDMTRAQLIKGTFRALTLKFARLQVPLIFTNHTYQTMELFSKDVMSGGAGPLYNASTIVFLSKAQIKEGTEKVGNIINMLLAKGRQTKEGSRAQTRLFFDRGLDRYYGLTQFAIDAGIWSKSGKKIVVNEKNYWQKTIDDNAEEFFTEDVLKQLDEYIQSIYLYGSSVESLEESEESEDK